MNRRSPAVLTAAVLVLGGSAHAATFVGPTEYLSTADSPFSGHSGWTVDNLEDDSLLPGITASAGSIIGAEDFGSLVDSVDADDGAIDGVGQGRSIFTGDGGTGITFTFDATILGGLPLSVGIVWTDGGGTVRFEAFDATDTSLGFITGSHADGGFSGTTAEDRFYGASNLDGIRKITISNTASGIELDHIQFSFAVPSPSSAAPLAILALISTRRRR